MQTKINLLFCCIVLFTPAFTSPVYGLELKLIQVDKIWDKAPTNAFTDLVRFQDQFFCVFREGEAHVSPAGKIRVIASGDGERWESKALIAREGYDLRDPKITVHPDGERLMINGSAAVREGSQPATRTRSFVAFSGDGSQWSPLHWVAEPGQWLWRLTWHEGDVYGVAYDVRPRSREQKQYGTTLLNGDKAAELTPLVENLFNRHGPTEATLRFAGDGTLYCLQRRDGRESNTALLGTAKPPYTDWQWRDLGRYLGGPNFIQIPSGQWLAAGRFHTEDGSKTVICRLDVEQANLHLLLTLPSGGDTSYPGMLWHNNQLWLSYYSSHEGKTSIYLAQVKMTGE